jgi:GrpB-like predicted nucleotidyltransferase (UPF0157 family)
LVGEAARIWATVGEKILAVEHYGSTAVPGPRAKPVIDLLIGVADIAHGLLFVEPMATFGYDYAGDQGIPEHHISVRNVPAPTWRMLLSTRAAVA